MKGFEEGEDPGSGLREGEIWRSLPVGAKVPLALRRKAEKESSSAQARPQRSGETPAGRNSCTACLPCRRPSAPPASGEFDRLKVCGVGTVFYLSNSLRTQVCPSVPHPHFRRLVCALSLFNQKRSVPCHLPRLKSFRSWVIMVFPRRREESPILPTLQSRVTF